MTDRFEEAVRQAAQGLGDDAPGDMPSYHGAWQRGRRRRMLKQGGIAFAGAAAVVAALTLSVGNMPGRGSVELDVALPVEVATGAPLLPTTAPVFVPTSVPEPEDTTPAPAQAQAQAPAAVEPAVTVAPEPTESPDTDSAASATAEAPAVEEAPTVSAQTEPAPATVPASPTPVPTDVVVPDEPTPVPTPTATLPIQRAPTPTAVPTGQGAEDTGLAPEGTAPDTADTATLTSPGALPNVTFIGPDQKPDAVLLESPLAEGWLACDVDQDGEAEATCKLMETYPCSSAADERLGYLAVDLDEDGEFDTCVAVAATACDTNGDGFADTACSIEFLPGPVDSGSDPEESQEDG